MKLIVTIEQRYMDYGVIGPVEITQDMPENCGIDLIEGLSATVKEAIKSYLKAKKSKKV